MRGREKEGGKESVVSRNISTMPRIQRLISKRYIFPDKIAERRTKKGNALRRDQRSYHVRQAQLLFIRLSLSLSLTPFPSHPAFCFLSPMLSLFSLIARRIASERARKLSGAWNL